MIKEIKISNDIILNDNNEKLFVVSYTPLKIKSTIVFCQELLDVEKEEHWKMII